MANKSSIDKEKKLLRREFIPVFVAVFFLIVLIIGLLIVINKKPEEIKEVGPENSLSVEEVKVGGVNDKCGDYNIDELRQQANNIYLTYGVEENVLVGQSENGDALPGEEDYGLQDEYADLLKVNINNFGKDLKIKIINHNADPKSDRFEADLDEELIFDNLDANEKGIISYTHNRNVSETFITVRIYVRDPVCNDLLLREFDTVLPRKNEDAYYPICSKEGYKDLKQCQKFIFDKDAIDESFEEIVEKIEKDEEAKKNEQSEKKVIKDKRIIYLIIGVVVLAIIIFIISRNKKSSVKCLILLLVLCISHSAQAFTDNQRDWYKEENTSEKTSYAPYNPNYEWKDGYLRFAKNIDYDKHNLNYSLHVLEFSFDKSFSGDKYVAYCADPGESAAVTGTTADGAGINRVACRPLSINKPVYARFRAFLRDTITVNGVEKKIIDLTPDDYNYLSNAQIEFLDYYPRLLMVYSLYINSKGFDYTENSNKAKFLGTLYSFAKKEMSGNASHTSGNSYIPGIDNNGHYDKRYADEEPYKNHDIMSYHDDNVIKLVYERFMDYNKKVKDRIYDYSDFPKSKNNTKKTTAVYDETTTYYNGTEYRVRLKPDSELQKLLDDYQRLVANYNGDASSGFDSDSVDPGQIINFCLSNPDERCCKYSTPSSIAKCLNRTTNASRDQINELVRKINNYPKYDFEVEVISGTNKKQPKIKVTSKKWNNAAFTLWNENAGKGILSVRRADGNSSNSITFNLTDEESSSTGTPTAYYCYNMTIKGGRQVDVHSWQHYITFLPEEGKLTDIFTIDLFKVDGVSSTPITVTPGTCPPVSDPHNPDDYEIHNCCEDEAESRIVQKAYDELFCDYDKDGVYVKNALPRQGAEEYNTNNTDSGFCQQYCGATIKYKTPKPTKAIADRSFSFSENTYKWVDEVGNELPFEGVYLAQYRRCRTIIYFDDWYKRYDETASNIVDGYNTWQSEVAKALAWERAQGTNANGTVCKTQIDIKYSLTCSKTFTFDVTQTTEQDYYYYTDSDEYDGYHLVTSTTTSDSENDDDAKSTTQISSKTSSKSSGATQSVSTDDITITASKEYSKKITQYDVGCGTAGITYPTLKKDITTYSSYHIISGDDKGTKLSGKYIDADEKDDIDELADAAAKSLCDSITTSHAETAYKSGKSGTFSFSHTSSKIDSYKASTTQTNTIDPKKEKEKHEKLAKGGLEKYEVNADYTTTLYQALDRCGGEIAPEEGREHDYYIISRAEYKEEDYPNMQFSYASAFIDDFGTPQTQELLVPFKRTCVQEFTSSFANDYANSPNRKANKDQEWLDDWEKQGWPEINKAEYYSTNNKFHDQRLTVDIMKRVTPANTTDFSSYLTLETSSDGHKEKDYVADTKFVTDAVARLRCKWSDEVENNIYTIVPAGVVGFGFCTDMDDDGSCTIEAPDEMLEISTVHQVFKKHQLYKTHARGRFETYFTLSNLAQGTLDDFVSINGETCSHLSGEDISVYGDKNANATCYFDIKQEGMLVLDCSRSDGGVFSLNNKSNECEEEKKMLLEYKEVDPSDLFPNDVSYGWNWKTSEQGQITKTRIEQTAADDATYSPDNLTYSFTLGPEDIRQIRQYNLSQVKNGGYANFEMQCEFEGEVNGKKDEKAKKCKSLFLTAISGGEAISYDGGSLSLNTNNMNLEEVRNNWPNAE